MQVLDASWAVRLAELDQGAGPHPWRERQYADSANASDLILGEVEGDALTALAVLRFVLDEAELLNIAVAKSSQGRGLGRAWLAEVLDTCRQRGARMVFLEVRRSNLPAQALYQRAGFREIGCRRDYYPTQTGREDALCLALTLSEETHEPS